jgi:hypothetical protein
MALKAKPKAAAKAAPAAKLNAGKGASKPAKALKKAAVPKEPKLAVNVGQEVEFVAYAEQQDEPMFEAGERLVVVEKNKNDDGQQVFICVKAEDYEAYQADPDSVNGDELFATEIKKAEKLPDDPYAFQLAADPDLDALLAENDGDALAAANSPIEGIASTMFLLGGCLATLYAGRKFLEYGDENEYADLVVDGTTKVGTGWDKFCQDNFDMGGRKAHGMIQIYRNYNGLSDVLDLHEIASDKKIGWVKLSAAAGVITKDNAEAIIEQARTQNVHEFKESIKVDYVDGGAGGGDTRSATAKVKRTRLTVAFFEDAGVAVEEVLSAAKKQLGTDDLGTVLEFIIMSWATDNLSDTQQKKVRSARKNKLNELSKQGVDVKERKQAMTDLEAQIEEARGGETSDETETDGDETE